MHYKMTKPCDACPFLKGSGFTYQSLEEHASGEFPCHKACDLVDDEEQGSIYVEKPKDKTPHCAGALIFHMKRGTSTQMMRICERLRMFDPSKLDMDANVVEDESDCRPPDRYERKRRRA